MPDGAQMRVLEALERLHAALKPRRLLQKKVEAKGIYIWGSVGRGKSMLMDVFFETAPVEQKRRVHFHHFMQEVHASIHEIRQQRNADPVATLVDRLAKTTRLLCFDELQATDVADASLLFRLFEGLFMHDVVIVATSNHPPKNLYTGGIQAERFHKFTELLEREMEVMPLTSATDYRREQGEAQHQTYFTPLTAENEAQVERLLAALAPGAKPKVHVFTLQGRQFGVTRYRDGVFRASFAELCETALGPADYLTLARAARTLALTGIPILTPEKRNEAKRFVTLIDALYESKTQLICTAAALPDALYPSGDGSFEFRRTASRLIEMQSEAYLAGLKRVG